MPFLVVFIELLFVFQSLWLDKSGYYYVFGFLGVVAAILMVTVVEVSVIATYLQLCSEVCWHILPFDSRVSLVADEYLTELPLVVALFPRGR